jgi:hypothetical protein
MIGFIDALFLIILNYNNSQSIFSRTLLPLLPRTRSIFILTVQIEVKVKGTLRLMVSQSVSLGVELHLGIVTRY